MFCLTICPYSGHSLYSVCTCTQCQPGGVGDPYMADISHHQLRGEGMFRDEEDGPVQVDIQTDPGLTVGTQIYLDT